MTFPDKVKNIYIIYQHITTKNNVKNFIKVLSGQVIVQVSHLELDLNLVLI